MNARKIFSITIAASILLLAATATSAQEWGGVYKYRANFGKSAGGSVILIDYSIAIEDGSNPAAEITADGYQTSNTILCTTRKRGNSIQLRFLSYPGGGLENEYGVKLYEVGDVLITLTKVVKSGKATYRADIGKYNTDIKGPVLFRKVQ